MEQAQWRYIETDQKLKSCLFLYNNFYKFHEASEKEDIDSMLDIFLDVRTYSEEEKEGSFANRLLDIIAKQLIEIVNFIEEQQLIERNGGNRQPPHRSMLSLEDLFDTCCKGVPEFSQVGLILQGMDVESAQVSAALGMKPSWPIANPF